MIFLIAPLSVSVLDVVESKLSFKIWRLCLVCSLGSAMLLQGCALPGFGFVRAGGETAGFEKQHIIGYRPIVEDQPVDAMAPEGAITPISTSLIRAQAAALSTEIAPEIRGLFGKAPAYTIGAGDVIGIIIYDHPELLPNAGAVIAQQSDPTGVSVAPGFIVGSTGLISFPYVGKLKLSGLTEIEATELIEKTISVYIRDPQVTVRIQSFRSRKAYMEGEVRNPGIQIFTDIPMTLAEAISRSGGITAAGDRSYVDLTREDKTYRIDLPSLLERGVSASAIPLRNGDVINVRSREESKVYVMGEIVKPSALLMRNGRLTLNDALGEAGGPNPLTANTGQIYVIRNGVQGQTQIFNLDAKNPAFLALAEKFALLPKDVVYIDPVPLALWSRIVSLILPSAQVIYFGGQTAQTAK